MREIKFRAWDARTNKWYASYNAPFIWALGDDALRLWNAGTAPAYTHRLAPDDVIVMQFTGLHDKNGKEIYEGDILQWTDGDMWKGVVEWSEGDADFLLDNPHASLGGFETRPTLNGLDSIRSKGYSVIGNIYENPELLSPQKVD